MVNGNQLTINFFNNYFHSFKCEQDVRDLIHNLNQAFKTNFKELIIHKGKVHDYLGINIDYTRKDYVKFTMYNFIEDVLKEAVEDMNSTAVTPASNNMFEIDNKSDPLDHDNADYFHQMTARVLFVSKGQEWIYKWP